jgi:hypothetical protein
MLAGALMGLSSIWIFVRTSFDVEFHTLMSRLSSLHYSTISLVRRQLLLSSFTQLCIDVYLVAAASALAANTVFRSAAGAVFPVRLSSQALTVDT